MVCCRFSEMSPGPKKAGSPCGTHQNYNYSSSTHNVMTVIREIPMELSRGHINLFLNLPGAPRESCLEGPPEAP